MVAKEVKTRNNRVLSYILMLFLACLGLYFKIDSCNERNIDVVGSVYLVRKSSSCYNDNFL